MSEFFSESDCDVIMNYPITMPPAGAISLAKANRLLRERGRVVYGVDRERFDSGWSQNKIVYNSYGEPMELCAQALLINITPITPPDTAESVLNEFIEWNACEGGGSRKHKWNQLIARARKIVGGG